MSRPLRKVRPDGTPYFRRGKVEAEIQALAGISPEELERCAGLWQASDPGFVSPEALLYFVRNTTASPHREKLTEKLLVWPAESLQSPTPEATPSR